MSRIQARFQSLKSQQRTALIPYVTAGDHNKEITVPLMHAMVDAGADLIELGVPFSDPMADGPVIQKASERALLHHTSLTDVLHMVRTFRETDEHTPVILMGYLNPVEIMGYETFARDASAAGVDAALIVDFPPEESHEFTALLKQHNMDTIFLLSPTTTDQRIQLICDQSSGFVYYVSVKGVTGSAALKSDDVAQRIALIKQKTDMPVGVGFGIKDAETAAAIGRFADAVIVGSANVNIIEQGVLDNSDNQTIITHIAHLLKTMRDALNNL